MTGENTIYVHEKWVGKRQEKNFKRAMQKQVNMKVPMCMNLYIRKMIKNIRRNIGPFTSKADYTAYIESVNKKGKKVLDKLSKTGYDVSRISAYAKQSIELGNYDEAHTEYRVKKIYEGE